MTSGRGVGRLCVLGAVGVACLAPWPFASVEPFWWALACALVLALSAPALLLDVREDRIGMPPLSALVALAPALVALVTLVPLPRSVVAVLSPGVPAALARAGAVPDTGWGTLSLFAPATLDSLVLMAACGAVAWVSARGAAEDSFRRTLAALFVTGGVLIAAFGLAQRLIDPNPQRMFWSVEIFEVGTPFGPYVNRNHFGGAMLLFTGVAAGRALAALGRARRVEGTLMTVAAVVTGVALAATASRGAVLGLAILALVLLAASPARHRLRSAGIVVAAGLLVVVALVATGLFDELAGRLFHVYGRWRNRFLVQEDALAVFADFPLFGTGAGSFPWVYHVFQGVDEARHFGDAHSDWVQIAMDCGLLGLAAVALVLIVLAGAARRGWRCPGPERWHVLGAAAGLAGLVIHGFFETNLHIPANALLAAVAAGLAYGASIAMGPGAGSQPSRSVQGADS